MLPFSSSAIRFSSVRPRGVPRARTQIRCHPSDSDTACTCGNESISNFRHNFHMKYMSEARYEVTELQSVGLQQDEEGEVQELMWSLLVHGILVSLPNSLRPVRVQIHAEL